MDELADMIWSGGMSDSKRSGRKSARTRTKCSLSCARVCNRVILLS